jgi:hypothetical protein
MARSCVNQEPSNDRWFGRIVSTQRGRRPADGGHRYRAEPESLPPAMNTRSTTAAGAAPFHRPGGVRPQTGGEDFRSRGEHAPYPPWRADGEQTLHPT